MVLKVKYDTALVCSPRFFITCNFNKANYFKLYRSIYHAQRIISPKEKASQNCLHYKVFIIICTGRGAVTLTNSGDFSSYNKLVMWSKKHTRNTG